MSTITRNHGETVFKVVLFIAAPDERDGGPDEAQVDREVAAALDVISHRRVRVADVEVWKTDDKDEGVVEDFEEDFDTARPARQQLEALRDEDEVSRRRRLWVTLDQWAAGEKPVVGS